MRALFSISFLLFMLIGGVLHAQQPVKILHDSLLSTSVAEEISYFPDPAGKYNIEQVSSAAFADSFQLVNEHYINMGYLAGPHWFRIDLQNNASAEKRFFFEVAYPPLDSLVFYQPDSANHWSAAIAGDMLPYNKSNGYTNYLFGIKSLKLQQQTYYFRVHTDGALTLPVYVYEDSYLQRKIALDYLKYGLFYGALLMILCYNLFLYLSLRLKPYLYYCLYLFFSIIAQAYLYGHAQQFLWTQGGRINNIVSGLTLYLALGFALLFTINFIRTRRFIPKIHRLLILLTFIIFGLGVLSIFTPYKIAIALVPPIYIFTVSVIVVSAAISWYKKQTTARLFLLAWLVYLGGLLYYSLQAMGIYGNVESASNVVIVGSVLEALFLSLALADRIRHYRTERQKANVRVVSALKEKQDMLEQQQQVLESRVLERTEKLQEKQKEVIKQNRQLFEQQQVIEKQNYQLGLLNENLEKIVGTRTGELRKANLSLHKRNQQLEQFAYFISHNLRGPVASIIGLINLFDKQKIGSAENLEYLNHLQKSSDKLDAVISDLNQVLALEQSLDQQKKQINVDRLIKGILEKLHTQIDQVQPVIKLDIKEKLIYSHQSYLESMLFNLISNAIKYRNEDKQLELSLSLWATDDVYYICISDNGMGIDLDQFGARLFTLYQRFHIDKEGRGLGLYMVKRQVESLGGTIQVESRPEQGATFTLSIPQNVSVYV